jgi:Ca-activated chloride channel homolog
MAGFPASLRKGNNMKIRLLAAALVLAGCAGTESHAPPAQKFAAPVDSITAKEPVVAPATSTLAASVAPPPPAKIAPPGAREARAPAFPSGVAAYSHSYSWVAKERTPSTYPGVDRFPDKGPTETLNVAEHPVSTFSIDVDTASYAFVRRYLSSGNVPPRDAVRVEEMVNYFPYAYPAPASRAQPFLATTSVLPCPWNAGNQLVHIAVRGYDTTRAERPRANVVLLVDTSGSMQPADRLPLLQQGFRLFAEKLRGDDRVAILTYAGHAQIALEPTPGSEKHRILEVIDGLRAGGSTAGAEGLQRAYALAERHFDREAVNRVILATDGDFNVGISDPKELERFIAAKRKTGIYLSILGVGLGNLNDALMQRLAQAGNGNAAYIDSLLEARKAMSEELSSTLFPIANDVKIQVEFNPARVAAYRLIGYETRMLRREDFKDDKVDAGDIGAGHSVTALYEITPAGAAGSRVDPLRYQPEREAGRSSTAELAFVKMRYKVPGEAVSKLVEYPVRAAALGSLEAAPAEQRFAVAVAAFAQRLRGESALEGFGYPDIAALANAARGADPEGYRAEFVRLVRMADSLDKVSQR